MSVVAEKDNEIQNLKQLGVQKPDSSPIVAFTFPHHSIESLYQWKGINRRTNKIEYQCSNSSKREFPTKTEESSFGWTDYAKRCSYYNPNEREWTACWNQGTTINL